MNCSSALISALTLLATPLAALQTTASAVVRIACSTPAPLKSLVAAPTAPLTYVPNSGAVIVIEMESLPAQGNWVEETTLGGFGGDSYFRWNGPNLFGTPNVDTLNYTFEIKTEDDYFIRTHVRHDDPDPSMENDCWARISTDAWEKLFNNTGVSGVGKWSYNSRYESNGLFPEYHFTPGVYTYQISGRSHNFKMDRIHVLPKSTFFANLSDPQSDVRRSRPIINQMIQVEIDDPTNSAGMTAGLARTGWYAGLPGIGYPCGATTGFGELLILGPGGINLIGGFQIWNGPGQPNLHVGVFPNDINLVGMTFITQGLLFQPGNFEVTDGLELNVGDI